MLIVIFFIIVVMAIFYLVLACFKTIPLYFGLCAVAMLFVAAMFGSTVNDYQYEEPSNVKVEIKDNKFITVFSDGMNPSIQYDIRFLDTNNITIKYPVNIFKVKVGDKKFAIKE